VSKDRRLGKGLAALLGAAEEESAAHDPSLPRRRPADDIADAGPTVLKIHEPPVVDPGAFETDAPSRSEILKLEISKIDDNPFQPRRRFDETEIAALAESLQEHDMLQPILVRRAGDRYQLISGERRLRAATKAGWTTVPAQLRVADDRLVAELALVENLQREDLNAIEKATSFQRYIAEHGCTQEDLAQRVKINRATIANFLRLLELPEEVQSALIDGRLSAGHARALLPLGDEAAQSEFCRRIARDGLSVRDVEEMVKDQLAREDGAVDSRENGDSPRTRSDHLASLEQELRLAVGAKVDVRQSAKGRGRIVIHFKNHEEFDRVFAFLTETVYQEPARKAG
jgi:ParB family chromosome partitioning protein